MAECLIHQLSHNLSQQLLDKCGARRLEVYAEINGPRPARNHPLTGRRGYLLDDGTIDYDGPGPRIFLPQHFRIRDLHESHPNATWILNWRDPEAWVESVMKWGDNLPNQFLNEYHMQGAIPRIPTNATTVRELLKRLYVEHHTFVRDFVRRHPSHALVEVNITDEDAGNVLADAFGLSGDAWMNVNQNRKPMDGWRAERIDYFDLAAIAEIAAWLIFVLVVTAVYAFRSWVLGVW
jgi:Sulfotransferase domain